MFNKIYRKVCEFIRENIVEIIVYLFLLFMVLCPVNYYIITGGGSFDASKRIVMESKSSIKGSFNMAYVSEVKGTIFTYLLSYIVPSFDRESVDDYKASSNEDVKDIEFRNTLWLRQTNNSALYVAFTKAKESITLKSRKNYIFYVLDDANTNLEVGDEIISIDGEKINDLDELKKFVNTKKSGDKLAIKIKKNKKEEDKWAYVYEEDGSLYMGVTLLEDESYATDPKVQFKFKSSESGPSGGLMMSLQIYNMLTKKDITNGLKIVGTGMIEKDGTVGEIDGVKYKLAGAVKNKADVFLVPSGRNYKEAVKAKKKNNYKIKIIKVKNFDEAISKLNTLKK